jgi:hypothetical protein
MKLFVALVVCVLLCGTAHAKPRRYYTYTQGSNATYASGDNSTAQGVAEMQASRGVCSHFGGNSGYEGVGFSTSSADDAIRRCCYWGQRRPRDIGVARGPRGWHACVRYE